MRARGELKRLKEELHDASFQGAERDVASFGTESKRCEDSRKERR